MKCLKWIALTTVSLSCLAANAGNIPVTVIDDNYIGAGFRADDTSPDVKGSKSVYDTQSMTVSRIDNIMTVVINSNFVGNNDGDIGFGDLFMSVDESDPNANPWKPFGNASDNYKADRFAGNNDGGNHVANTGTDWNYAYTIRDWVQPGGNQPDNWVDRHNTSSGKGQLVSGFTNSDLQHSNTSSNRHHQAVSLKSSVYDNGYANSTYSYDKVYYNQQANDPTNGTGYSNWSASNGALTFSFDVTGSALATANQIAFRWAMTCANDIIEGLVSVNPGGEVKVPEPQTLLLMLLGMAGIAYRRKSNV
jgi:hypothetical protein